MKACDLDLPFFLSVKCLSIILAPKEFDIWRTADQWYDLKKATGI